MKDDRDMFYSNYGYAGMPNPMMGMNPNMMIPNMMMNPNMGYPSSNQGGYANTNQGMNSVNASNLYSDIENRLTKVERQIKRLDQRVSRLEAPYSNNTTNIYNEPDSNMYMI